MASKHPLSTLRISIADMMHLRVRAKGRKQDALPELLYQRLPMDSMSIMSTLPRGLFAVSIPHRNFLGCGYEIVRTPPPADGFVIVYARQPNKRYEAVSVIFRGKTIGIPDFHEEARQWTDTQIGELKPVPHRYAYLSPARDHWAVILRDNGYAVLDPSKLPNSTARGPGDDDKNLKGGIFARIPVYTGSKRPQDPPLPVFEQVELTSDSHPNSRSLWIPFIEYEKTRALRSIPPAGIIPDFCDWLQLLTANCGFDSWIFRPGTRFGDRVEWWGDRNRRRTEHEGLDFVEGLKPDRTIGNVPELTPVYAIADGDVVAVLDDFLGKTVVMRHRAITDESSDVFYTFLSHIQPVSNRLEAVTKARLLGRVGKSANAGVPPHLHLTGAWIPQAVAANAITLDHLHPANTSVILINFNELTNSSPLCVISTPSDV